MKNHIAEELPARKFPQDSGKPDNKKEGGKSPEQKIRQAVYDIRYRARREEITLQQAYSQYMSNSSMTQQEKTVVREKLFGKSGAAGVKTEDYNIKDFASNNVANALYKVFVEGVQEPLVLTYMEKLETSEHKKYKVRVTDKNGRSYVRYADRAKINSLRANPNIESVEMTGYGEPYEGEKNKGEQTAAAKSGKDWDRDGKVESGAKEYRGVVHNAIQKRKGGNPDGKDTSNVKEEFLGELQDTTKIKENTKVNNKITMNPPVPGAKNMAMTPSGIQLSHYDMEGPFITEKAKSKSQQKFMGMVYAAKKGKKAASPEVAKAAAGMSEKEARKFAKTKHKGLPTKVEEAKECDDKERDSRGDYAKMNVLKNKARAMGCKNPIIITSEEAYQVDENLLVKSGLAAGALYGAGQVMKGLKGKVDKEIDKARKTSPIGGERRVPQLNSYEIDGDFIDEGTEEAQERRFQKHGDRSEGETHTRLIGKAARANDRLRSRQKRTRPDHPKHAELQRRQDANNRRSRKLQKARQNDTSKFRQGPVDR